MPVVAVASAVMSVGAAYTATAGFTVAALNIWQTIGTVSSVIGAVGAVTKDKTLQKIGMIGSLVGGVGSYAQASGWLEKAGMKATEGAAFNTALTKGKLFDDKYVAKAANVSRAAANATDAAYDYMELAATPPSGSVVTPGSAEDYENIVAGLSSGTPVENPLLSAARTQADTTAATLATAENALKPSGPGFFDGFLEFAKDNGTVAYGMLTTAGTAVAGLFDPTVEGTVAKTEAEAAYLKTQNDILAQQTANIAAPLTRLRPTPQQQVAQNMFNPVTGKPLGSKVVPGLINTVTGVPA